jgi:6-phosphofructokinase 1
LVPEVKFDRAAIIERLEENRAKGKKSGIIVAAEGIGDTRKLGIEIEKDTGAEVRLSVLGYAQRGGSPTARSRLLASMFAEKAVECLLKKEANCIVGLQNGKIGSISLEESCRKERPIDLTLLELADVLST